MLRRTRIGSHMDTSRLGASISRPGIDPRTWVSLAVALGESVVDPNNKGVFLDIQLIPTMERMTARVPAAYAGVGFGLYAKIHKDDEVTVAIPNGNPMAGAVVIARMWNGADTPPATALASPDDVLLVVKPGKNLGIELSGGGKLSMKTAGGDVTVETGGGKATINTGGGQVLLGDAALTLPLDGVVHGSGIDSFTGVAYAVLGNASAVVLAKK